MNNENERPIEASEYEFKSHITESGAGEPLTSVYEDFENNDVHVSNATEEIAEPKGKKYTDSEYEISSLPNTSDAGFTE